MNEGLAEKLEKLYQLPIWSEDLSIGRAKERLEEAYEVFRELLSHLWFQELLENKDTIVVIDVCSGTGIGGIALAKALIGEGLKVKLVFNDLRASALAKAKEYAKQILGLEPVLLRVDALELYKQGIRADIALMYGVSAPHFNPYQMVQLVAGIAWILEPSGLFLVDEFDRVYGLLCRVGCKDITIEHAGEDRVLLTLGAGYDPRTGMFRRVFLDMPAMTRLEIEYRMWDIAGIAAILWAFFKDVDFKPTKTQLHGILIAREPRRINPQNYTMPPTMVRSNSNQ